jgi:hypothetical protein
MQYFCQTEKHYKFSEGNSWFPSSVIVALPMNGISYSTSSLQFIYTYVTQLTKLLHKGTKM